MKSKIFIQTLAAIASLLIFAGCQQKSKEATTQAPQQKPAKAQTVETQKKAETENELGNLKFPEKFYMGANTHFAQRKGYLSKSLSLLKQGGFNSLRDELSWGGTEQEKGVYKMPAHTQNYVDAAYEMGIASLCVLDYGNRHYLNGGYPQDDESRKGFANFSEFMVKSFGEKIPFYQVWNEWDGGCGMSKFRGTQTSEGYAALLKETYKKIKEANPNAIVVANSICRGDNYFDEYLAKGTIKDCDVLSIHTYNYSNRNGTAESWYFRMIGVDEIIKKHNAGKSKYTFVTEMGFPNQINHNGFSDYYRTAKESCKVYLLARCFPWLKGLWWYDFQDDGTDYKYNEDNFGLIRIDFTPKQAYFALKSIADIVTKGDFVEKVEFKKFPSVWMLKFKLNGEDVIAVWNSDENSEAVIKFKNSAKDKKAIKSFIAGSPERTQTWGSRDWLKERNAKVEADILEFTARDMPLILKGDFSKAEIVDVKLNPFNVALSELSMPRHKYVVRKNAAQSVVEDISFNRYDNRKTKENQDEMFKNLSGKFSANHNTKELTLNIDITDNVFVKAKSENNYKCSDYLLFEFKSKDPETLVENNAKISVIHLGGKTVVLGLNSEYVSAKTEVLDGKRKYTISFKPEFFGIKSFESGTTIAGSFFAHDSDDAAITNPENAFIRWGRGVGPFDATNSSGFYMMILE